jgi:hypothetical protein
LQKIIWKSGLVDKLYGHSEECYVVDLEKVLNFADRFRSAMVIYIYPNGVYSINLGSEEQMKKAADRVEC